nr:hypothetical protein [Desulfobacterales bacterium]
MNATKVIAEENCSGCLLCALACSFFNQPDRVFNLSKSQIKVERIGGQNRFKISFKEDCIECGTCADYCHYGVLSYQALD